MQIRQTRINQQTFLLEPPGVWRAHNEHIRNKGLKCECCFFSTKLFPQSVDARTIYNTSYELLNDILYKSLRSK